MFPRTLTTNFLVLFAGLFAFGCDVYDPSFLQRFTPDGGCRRGTADCDENGSCEAELSNRSTCGSCTTSCVGAQVCNPSTLSCEGDAGMFDAAVEDTGVPDTSMPPDTGPVICGTSIPERPDVLDEVDTATRTYALRDIVIDQRGTVWEELGWNLDGRCTVAVTDEPECLPPEGDFPPLDGSGGVDNVFGERVLGTLADLNPTFQPNARQEMAEGDTIVIRLKDWNGTDNDPNVEVLAAAGVEHVRLDGNPLPQWDGNDRWNVATTSFSGGNPDRPLIVDNNAYVVNRRLVARIPDRQPLVIPWIDSNNFQLRITDGRITARISNDGNALENLSITGRYGDIDLADAWTRAGLCEGGSIRGLLDRELGEDLDVRSIPGSGGPGVECNAMSLAIGFTGFLALYGEVVEPPPEDPVECIPDPF
ncbi:MAG: hypothetical protein AAGE52_28770 [Myxococcota bacterium]